MRVNRRNRPKAVAATAREQRGIELKLIAGAVIIGIIVTLQAINASLDLL
jgi:hypothetical protein